MTIWLAADCETTGVGNNDKVVELAYIAFDDTFNELFRGSSLIDPEMPIPSGASAVNGITNKMVADEPTIEQFMRMNNDPLMVEDAVLVAYNAPFDFRFLRGHMHETADHMCTMRLSKMIWPGLDSYKMQALKYSLELPEVEGDAHRAMADVEMMVNLIRKMFVVTGLDMQGLREMAKKPLPVTKWGFGKHKGQKIDKDSSEHRSYASWLLKQENVDPDLAATLRSMFFNHHGATA